MEPASGETGNGPVRTSRNSDAGAGRGAADDRPPGQDRREADKAAGSPSEPVPAADPDPANEAPMDLVAEFDAGAGEPADARRVLYRREVGGLRLALLARVVAYAVLLGSSLLVGTNATAVILSVVVAAAAAVLTLFALVWIDRERDLRAVGYAGLGLDCLVLLVFPAVWYWSAGGSDLPAAYLSGVPFGQLAVLVLVINTLTLRPAYPLIGTAATFLIGLAHYAIIVADPRTAFATDPAVAFMEGAVDLRTAALGLAQIVAAGLLLTWLASMARSAVNDASDAEVSTGRLRRFFSPAVVGQFVAGRGRGAARPRLQEAAVLFCRPQAFAGLSETYPPGTAVAWLADYRQRMLDLVFAFGGTANQVSGETLLVTFGAPTPLSDAPLRAVRCGIAMKRELARWNAERAERGEPQIRQGLGIHHGRIIAGFIGDGVQSDYASLGDTVDVAVRLGQACEELGEVFLVTATVADWAADSLPLRKLEHIQVEGRRAPVDVFAVDFGRPAGARPSRRTSLWGRAPGDDGPVRDILAGRKTTMCCPLAFWGTAEDPATIPGDRIDIYDGQGRYRCTVQVTEVAQIRFGAPDPRTIRGEQCRDLQEFQAKHAGSWSTDLAALGQPLDDDTVIVVEHFVLAELETPKRV